MSSGSARSAPISPVSAVKNQREEGKSCLRTRNRWTTSANSSVASSIAPCGRASTVRLPIDHVQFAETNLVILMEMALIYEFRGLKVQCDRFASAKLLHLEDDVLEGLVRVLSGNGGNSRLLARIVDRISQQFPVDRIEGKQTPPFSS
jgi:hypothetical protein